MGCQIGALKLLIIIPNFVFFGVGCSLIGFTSYVLIQWNEDNGTDQHKDYIIQELNVVSGTVIAAGVILCMVSLLACCGAAAAKRKMLTAYAIILCLVILLEIVGAIFAFLAANHINDSNEEIGPKIKFDGSNSYILGLVLAIVICIEIILALIACLLAKQIKRDRIVDYHY